MNLRQNVFEIRQLLEARKEAIASLSRFLISRGITGEIAEEIAQKLVRDQVMKEKEQMTLIHLKEAIAARIKTRGEFCFKQPQRVVIVGPTGVGKSATLMKLALRYQKLGKHVGLYSLDEWKKGFLEMWAQRQGICYLKTLDEVKELDLILIDTEGCNFYQPNRIEELGEKIAICGPEAEVILALSVSAKEVDLYGAIHQFSPLCPKSLLFTKFDETLASGVIINICEKTDIPIRYISFGFPLPGEVQIADAKSITHKILADFNEEEFQVLRQLTLSQLN